MSPAEKKQQIRERLLRNRRLLPEEYVDHCSRKIAPSALGQIGPNTKTIHCFLPIKEQNEINTWLLINGIWKRDSHIKVAVPVVKSDSLSAALISNNTEFTTDRFSAPVPVRPSYVEQALNFDIVFVPLSGFDKNGNRVGFGQGFYDKFLERQSGKTIGLAYDEQLVEKGIPAEKHDIPLHSVVTPTQIYYFR